MALANDRFWPLADIPLAHAVAGGAKVRFQPNAAITDPRY